MCWLHTHPTSSMRCHAVMYRSAWCYQGLYSHSPPCFLNLANLTPTGIEGRKCHIEQCTVWIEELMKGHVSFSLLNSFRTLSEWRLMSTAYTSQSPYSHFSFFTRTHTLSSRDEIVYQNYDYFIHYRLVDCWHISWPVF